jgi:integrase
MSAIFRHGIRWAWIGQHQNPVAMVRVSSKRLRTPDVLDTAEFQALFAKLPDRERAMGTICATTGLRISEALGLKWGDIDFVTGLANVLRSVVDGSVGRCKTEVSQQPVPMDQLTLEELQAWRSVTPYALSEDWTRRLEGFNSMTPFPSVYNCSHEAGDSRGGARILRAAHQYEPFRFGSTIVAGA